MGKTIKMPSAEEIDKAYNESRTRVPERYKTGVARNTNQKEQSLAGQTLYVEQMSDAAVLKRREDKIRASPDSAWKDGALDKGSKRIGEGMRLGAAKRKANYEPIRGGLDGLVLADKTSDFKQNIINNVTAVVEAQKKAAGKL